MASSVYKQLLLEIFVFACMILLTILSQIHQCHLVDVFRILKSPKISHTHYFVDVIQSLYLDLSSVELSLEYSYVKWSCFDL